MTPQTRTRAASLALLVGAVLATTTACGLPLAGGDDEHPTGVPDGWYATLDKEAAAAKKAGHFGGTPYLDADKGCALVDEVALGKDGDDGSEESFATGAADPGKGGAEYICQFTDPSLTLYVARWPKASVLDEVEADARAADNPDNEQTDHTYTVGERRILVRRTVYPTNDSHIDYTATYLDRSHRGAVQLQVETTGDLRGSYSGKQAARDLDRLLSGS